MLGSTGSIGVQALQVIDAARDLEACGLSCRSNADRMAEQAAAHGIAHTACAGGGGTVDHDPALAALIVVVADRSDSPAVDPYEVTVAADTAAGLASGEVEDVVPAIIRLQPGQELVLRNNDFSPHTLGDLTAERGSTVRMSFPSEGRNITATSLRRDGRLTILVEAPR